MLKIVFGDNAVGYARWRPDYPLKLFTIILKYHHGGYGTEVDLGAGTGASCIYWAKKFHSVVAVEPDSRMLRQIPNTKNVRLVCSKAEEMTMNQSSTDLVTCGNSFYWMNGQKVMRNAFDWLRAGGTFAAFRYGFPKAINGSLDECLSALLVNQWDKYRSTRLRDENYTQRLVLNSPLWASVTVQCVPNVVEMTASQLTGFLCSTSYVLRYLAGKGISKTQYSRELFNELGRFGDRFKIDFGVELVLAKKDL